ncbi:MAG: alanine dehydrogenase [Janthinobacterium lividum]
MKIGVPKEIKAYEYRVGLTPTSVRELIHHGHQVLIETSAGIGSGFSDEDYAHCGAEIMNTAQDVFAEAEMIVKVKEPQPSETAMLRKDQILFTYLHLAPDPIQATGLINSRCVAIAYETVTNAQGALPLLKPMSEVAGRMSIQVGISALEKQSGGSGVLISGVPGVESGHVVVLGGGVVGTNALRMALGLEAQVTVIDQSLGRLEQLNSIFGGRLKTIYATMEAIEHHVTQADLVIGAVLIPGAAAPRLVTRDMLSKMRPGSVLVDVAIDQGGCFETSVPTTHDVPTYIVDGIVHYCVANMPGGVPRTSALALNNATLPFILDIANRGYLQALLENPHLMNGLNVCQGAITCEPVAKSLGLSYVDPYILLRDMM